MILHTVYSHCHSLVTTVYGLTLTAGLCPPTPQICHHCLTSAMISGNCAVKVSHQIYQNVGM